MDKRILLIGLLIGLVLLSGCVKIQFREEINAEGISNVSIEMDMSLFPDTGDGEEQNPCETMDTNESALRSVTCTYEDKVMTVSGSFDRRNTPGFTMGDGKYRLDVKQAFEAFDTNGSSGQAMPEDAAQISQLKALGFEMNYFVKLPGTLIEQKGGEVQDDGFVKFDMLDMPDDAFVESSTAGFFNLDTNTLLIIVGAAIVVLLAVLIVVMKR